MPEQDSHLQRYFPWLLAAGILLNIPALWLDIIDADSALYATIAKHMALNNEWLDLWADGHEWLDKPHFPFWMAAISFKIFGINSFAYKLPAFLFWLGGLRFTYLVARELFNADAAKIAVLLATVAYHSTLFNFDVRAEPYLTTCIIGSIWFMLKVNRTGQWADILLAALFAAMGMMTKGLFVLLTIWGGWVLYWFITGQWKQLFQKNWLLVAAFSLIFLFPELYSLYTQFDLHPEKVVFGKQGVSGLRFFFWDSQFGRFFNTGPIKGKGNIWFYLHTTLWAFLPWTPGLLGGVFLMWRVGGDRKPLRWVMYGSALLTFLLFSFSKFQLPHYIVILFPHFAILAAVFYQRIAKGHAGPIVAWIHGSLALLSIAAMSWLSNVAGIPILHAGVIAAFLVAFLFMALPAKNDLSRVLNYGFAMAGLIHTFFFLSLYPEMFHYQSGMQAAKNLPANAANAHLASYKSFSYTFEFYSPGEPALIHDQDSLQRFIDAAPSYLYTNQEGKDQLAQMNPEMKVIGEYPHYHITRFNFKFLRKYTRDSVTEPRYLLYFPGVKKAL